MTILFLVSVAGTLGYLTLLLSYLKYWHRDESAPAHGSRPFLSVIIAARNEAEGIDDCIRSVLRQSYPQDKYEVIVINDQSEDATADLVARHAGITLLHTTAGRTGKKHALALGVEAARGEIIVMTDADCEVGARWLETIADALDAEAMVVTGPVLYREDPTAFGRFQALDAAALAFVTASGIRSGFHHLGNGANMAFRKSACDAVGGFLRDIAHASGDDLFLIQRIAAWFPDSIRFLSGQDGVVTTRGCPTLIAFLSQRKRWATKNAHLPERVVHRIWIGIWMLFAVQLIYLISALWMRSALVIIPVSCIAVTFLIEYLVLRKVVTYYGRRHLLQRFLISAVLHYGYVITMGLIVPLGPLFEWKGRKVR